MSLSSSRRIRSFSNGTLYLMDAHIEDEGWFRCEAVNRDGIMSSSAFYLDVVGQYP